MNATDETRVAIAIVRQDERFLVGVRPEGVPLAGHAEFPGGKCRADESSEACAVRECLEETGIAVRVLRLRREFIHQYPHGRLRLAFFDCDPMKESTPAGSYRWIERAELATLRFPEANDAVLQELLGE